MTGTMEIGSEFWNAPVGPGTNALFPAGVQWYASGRSALKAILRDIGPARTAALPSWCCDSVVKPFLDAGMEVRFHPVRRTPEGLEQEIDTSCDILFVMDFFGFSPLRPPFHSHPCVIRDATHSLFSSPSSGARYVFGSLRKWCGVYGAGFAWSDHPLPMADSGDHGYAACRQEAMTFKARYLRDKASGLPCDGAKTRYLDLFGKAEETLDALDAVPAHPRDVFVASNLDADTLVRRRRANARILMDAFPELLLFPELRPLDVPLCVPILVPGGRRDALRRFLIQREIYLPVHWPRTPLQDKAPDPSGFYRDELSLVCDQRYSEADMDRMVRAIREFLKG
jgi:dTDP-4-amino-4,6-dideoxygalactose transaminase